MANKAQIWQMKIRSGKLNQGLAGGSIYFQKLTTEAQYRLPEPHASYQSHVFASEAICWLAKPYTCFNSYVLAS